MVSTLGLSNEDTFNFNWTLGFNVTSGDLWLLCGISWSLHSVAHELHSDNSTGQNKVKRERKLYQLCKYDPFHGSVGPRMDPFTPLWARNASWSSAQWALRLTCAIALAWNAPLGKDGVHSTRISRPDLSVQPFSCESGFQDQDQGPHPKAAQVNGKTLIVFSELGWGPKSWVILWMEHCLKQNRLKASFT